MAPVNTAGTCSPWAQVGDTCSPCTGYEFDTGELELGIQLATDVLNNLTGWQWPGLCTTTVRPCGYQTRRSCGCMDSRQCGCRRLSQLDLRDEDEGGWPIASVDAVKIDGVTLDPARYRVDDHRWLVYIPDGDSDPRRGWPCCQRIDLPDTEVDTWSVSYTYGAEPPEGGVRAAGILGCQYALACVEDESLLEQCQLPDGVRTVVRQGITLGVPVDLPALWSGGSTGVDAVDSWLGSIRYGKAHRPASFMVPSQSGSGLRHVGT